MDEHFTPRPMARWYSARGSRLAAVHAARLRGLRDACLTDPTTLPLDQRAMFEAEPRWVTTALGVASLVGSIGALMLLFGAGRL